MTMKDEENTENICYQKVKVNDITVKIGEIGETNYGDIIIVVSFSLFSSKVFLFGTVIII